MDFAFFRRRRCADLASPLHRNGKKKDALASIPTLLNCIYVLFVNFAFLNFYFTISISVSKLSTLPYFTLDVDI